VLGTDAASEGLNLQTLGTLINLDLPWNPTRLEQRKGRIQRIGQVRDIVFVHNLRYKDSVEDRVHALLSGRLQVVHRLFGQIPDILEDVWSARRPEPERVPAQGLGTKTDAPEGDNTLSVFVTKWPNVHDAANRSTIAVLRRSPLSCPLHRP